MCCSYVKCAHLQIIESFVLVAHETVATFTLHLFQFWFTLLFIYLLFVHIIVSIWNNIRFQCECVTDLHWPTCTKNHNKGVTHTTCCLMEVNTELYRGQRWGFAVSSFKQHHPSHPSSSLWTGGQVIWPPTFRWPNSKASLNLALTQPPILLWPQLAILISLICFRTWTTGHHTTRPVPLVPSGSRTYSFLSLRWLPPSQLASSMFVVHEWLHVCSLSPAQSCYDCRSRVT